LIQSPILAFAAPLELDWLEMLVVTATTLRALSYERQKDAEILMQAQRWHAGYYLTGYAIETAIKACIAKNVQAQTYPNKEFTNEAYQHKFRKLIVAAGLTVDFDKAYKDAEFFTFWLIIDKWDVERRYDGSVTQGQAEALYEAATHPKGFLPWIRNRWQ